MTQLFRKKPTLDEIEEETQKLEGENRKASVELSLAQKKVAIAELKKRGLTPKHFLFDWGKIVQWLKTH